MRQTGIVPLVGSRDIGFAERTSIRDSEDSLQALDLPDYLFQVHSHQYSEPPCKNPLRNRYRRNLPRFGK